MRWRELRRRLWPAVLALWLVSHLGVGLFLLRAHHSAQSASLERQLILTARAISLTAFAPPDTAAMYLSDAATSRAYVVILDQHGSVLREYPSSNIRLGTSASWPDVQLALAQGDIVLKRDYSPAAGGSLLFCSMPALNASGEIIGVVTVALPDAERTLNAERSRLVLTWVGLLAGGLLLAGVVLHTYSTWLEHQLNLLLAAIQGRAETGGPIPRALVPLWNAWTQAARHFQQIQRGMETEIAQLQSALDNMTDGVMIVNRQGRVLLMNPACRRLLDIPASEISGSFAQIVRDFRIVELWQRLFQPSAERDVPPASIEILRDHLTLVISGTRIPFAGEDRALILIQDVSEARRIEAMRRDFISNVSHELRTPLASIKALVETLREGALEDPPAARHFLQRIEIEVDTLTQMVQELLELARLESGRVILNLQTVNLAEVLVPAVDRLSPQAARAGLRILIDIPPDLPRVQMDPHLFQQVIANLVHNAIKFTPAGGEIRITARASADEITVAVSDTGVGIPKADLPRIFERFYKADRSRASGGTGLGLAIAKHVVLSHGGRIWAESQEGRGSTFYFTIPLAGPHAGAHHPPNR
jgi:two-component system phosphate regulon sensor histidine kinase PhoR